MGQPTPTSASSSSKASPVEVSSDKGKGILGSVPPKSPKEEHLIISLLRESRKTRTLVRGSSEDVTGNLYTLECPNFDCTDFRGWWSKLERFFLSKCVRDEAKVKIVMFHLEGKALDWHHFFVQRRGGPKGLVKSLSQAEMNDRRRKWLYFWCASKYTSGHKCHKSQLYQLVIEVSSDREVEFKSPEVDEFKDCNEQLKQGE
ncbi:hypothetical protein J1N35_010513 [Gossypium stocksii]|uniref:Retrotransposon gag domain-containing protein n=1 Tax=Gossypium stocksii TaxID=47602 RepID=A0A9D3W2B9_9ROSI|nr:hypothetical protein J1N35_010513 [Gossypium stocksii]